MTRSSASLSNYEGIYIRQAPFPAPIRDMPEYLRENALGVFPIH